MAVALELADLLAHTQRYDEAEAVLGGLDPAGLSPPERVMVTATRAMSLSFAPHRPDAALVVLDQAADLGPVPLIEAIRTGALMRAARVDESAKRNAESTDEDGTTQQCVLVTSGTPMDASAFKALAAMAGGATGQKVGDQLPSAAIGVVLNHLSKPATKEDMDGDMLELPPGSKKLSDVGLGGVAMNLPSGGFGIVLLDATHALYIMDLEGRKVAVEEMEKLLRAAASHYT